MNRIPLIPQVAEFIGRPQGLRIGDSEVLTEERITVLNPSDGSELGDVAAAGTEEVDAAVAAARAAANGAWGQMDGVRRGELLWRLADAIEERKEIFGQLRRPGQWQAVCHGAGC